MDTRPTTFYLSFLEQVLTPARLQHSMGVMQTMATLAGVYDLDQERAGIAGLLHDAAKDLPPVQREQLIMESGIQLAWPCEQDYSLYLHGPIGAYFVRKNLGVSDGLILDAIAMHTFMGDGDNFNTPFTWCLRFSDILEPNRNWDVACILQNKDRLWKTVMDGKLADGACLHTSLIIQLFEEKGFPIHPRMRRIVEELST